MINTPVLTTIWSRNVATFPNRAKLRNVTTLLNRAKLEYLSSIVFHTVLRTYSLASRTVWITIDDRYSSFALLYLRDSRQEFEKVGVYFPYISCCGFTRF